jgi:hypothetical protein
MRLAKSHLQSCAWDDLGPAWRDDDVLLSEQGQSPTKGHVRRDVRGYSMRLWSLKERGVTLHTQKHMQSAMTHDRWASLGLADSAMTRPARKILGDLNRDVKDCL